MVKKLGGGVGDKVTIRGEQYTVVGVLDKTLTAPDTTVQMTLADAQAIFVQDLPEVVRAQVDQIGSGHQLRGLPHSGHRSRAAGRRHQ